MKNMILMMTTMMAMGCTTLAFGGSSTVGVGNPASAACVQAGGQSEMVQDQKGNQDGICAFGRGIIEEWTFFKSKTTSPMAIQAFFQAKQNFESSPSGRPSMANPASVNCGKVGGQTVIVGTPEGEMGMCQFQDNSAIEEWTLFRGPSDPLNAELTNALR